MTKMNIDTKRGFDVMKRVKGEPILVAHYDNYEEAKKKASAYRSYFLRYWTIEPTVKG